VRSEEGGVRSEEGGVRREKEISISLYPLFSILFSSPR